MSEELNLPFQPGDLFADKYRIDRVLGAGGMGVVVAATHVDLERLVAIKLIRDELVAESSLVERLMLEAKAAAKIKSEHVGKVLDVGKLPSGAPYIVMEYLEGMDLCQLLEERGALRVTEAVDFLMQACEALAEAHLANIVHRDLKPENLFVTQQTDGTPIIKVLDFGISKQLGNSDRRQLTNPSTAVGSPRYMAPEQMQAAPIDVRADVWALGAILYECLGNHPAFDSDTLPGICAQVLGSNPVPVQTWASHVPDRLSDVIVRCLKKNPNERVATVAELAEALAPFGTERAEISRRRIASLLGVPHGVVTTARIGSLGPINSQASTSAAGVTALMESSPGTGTTGTGTASRGITVDVTGASSSAQSAPSRGSRRGWVYAITALGLVGVGGAVFFGVGFAERGTPPEPTSGVAVDSPTTGPAPEKTNPESTELGTPGVAPVVSMAVEAQEPTASASVASIQEPGPTGKSKPTVRQNQPRSGDERKPNEEKKPGEPKKTDAWDTDSFGGRK